MMGEPEWKDEYSVGVEEIDNQHRHMFILGKRITRLKRQQAIETARELYDYLMEHCATEEEHMRSIGFPDLERHREEHESILSYMRTTLDNFDANPRNILKLKLFYYKWLVNHVVETDKQYFLFARENQTPATNSDTDQIV